MTSNPKTLFMVLLGILSIVTIGLFLFHGITDASGSINISTVLCTSLTIACWVWFLLGIRQEKAMRVKARGTVAYDLQRYIAQMQNVDGYAQRLLIWLINNSSGASRSVCIQIPPEHVSTAFAIRDQFLKILNGQLNNPATPLGKTSLGMDFGIIHQGLSHHPNVERLSGREYYTVFFQDSRFGKGANTPYVDERATFIPYNQPAISSIKLKNYSS